MLKIWDFFFFKQPIKHAGGWQIAPAIIADEVLITATAINARSSLHTYKHTYTFINRCVCGWESAVRNGVYISLSRSHQRFCPPSLVNRKSEVYFSLILFLSVGSRNISRPCRPLSLTHRLLWTMRQGLWLWPRWSITPALAATLQQCLHKARKQHGWKPVGDIYTGCIPIWFSKLKHGQG